MDDKPQEGRPVPVIDPQNLTIGQRLVGLSFNPGKTEIVFKLKALAAAQIDMLLDEVKSQGGTHQNLINAAIHEAITAQMWLVKAATWAQPAPPEDKEKH